MKINSISPVFYSNFGLFKRPKEKSASKIQNYDQSQKGIYVKPIQTTKKQEDTISRALNELKQVEFLPNDVIYMKNLGVNLPFKNGMEAVNYLNSKHIDIMYAEFSDKNVHACLDTSNKTPVVLINSDYKDLATFPDILAISEAMIHEAGHAKDNDSINSIQEEIDCLALNVLAHQHYKKSYPDVFKNQNSPLYLEGVNLYDKLFFDFDPKKEALKRRVSDKYGYLNTASPYHAASLMAREIKEITK